jgi:hypothetical protein
MAAPIRALEPAIPPIEDDCAALKALLLWMRAHHYAPQGAITVGRVQLTGIADEHPRRLIEQGAPLPQPPDDPLGDFR